MKELIDQLASLTKKSRDREIMEAAQHLTSSVEINLDEETLYEFTLKLHEPTWSDEILDRIYSAGCDDALVLCNGECIHLIFSRDGDTFINAVESARNDLTLAGFSTSLVLD